MNTRVSRRLLPLVGAALAFLCLAAPGQVRADNLDEQLVHKAAKLVDDLHAQGHKNVGVLCFRVQKPGSKTASFGAGQINTNLATRLENALILGVDEKTAPLGVIRNASAVALRHKVGSWYTREAERKKLFEHSDYPLAWGTQKVKPDVFLTGLVSGPDRDGKTRVVIEAFTARAPKLTPLCSFEVGTDRSMLRDMGKGFVLSKRSIQGKTPHQLDQAATTQVRRRDAGEGGETPTPDNISGMAIQILYDGAPQQIVSSGSTEWRVNPARVGQKIELVLQHNGRLSERLGVVMSVNGVSTFKEQKGNPLTLQKWLFDPGDRAESFRGFYMDVKGDNLKPFQVLSTQESEGRAAEFGDRAGLIDIDVFANRPGPTGDEIQVSLRNISRRGLADRVTPGSLKALQTQLMQTAGLKRQLVVKRGDEGGLWVADSNLLQGEAIRVEKLENPFLVGHLTIRYYDPARTKIEITNQ